jgi:homoserine dehydrogenase
MEQGLPYAGALAEMQARGIAEADPSLDVDGWDAAAKAAVLANAWFDAGITPHDVARTGITGIDPRDVLAAAARGAHLRLVATGRRLPAGVDLRVAPEVLEPDDPLATLSGVENALYVTTDLLGEVGIVQRTGTLTQTAYALVADLARVAAVGAGHLPH